MPNLVTREDTLLGVCQGIGDEFGFNANWLRVALAASLLWNAAAVVGIYLALGAVLMLARWGWPVREAEPVAEVAATPLAADNDAPVALAQAA